MKLHIIYICVCIAFHINYILTFFIFNLNSSNFLLSGFLTLFLRYLYVFFCFDFMFLFNPTNFCCHIKLNIMKYFLSITRALSTIFRVHIGYHEYPFSQERKLSHDKLWLNNVVIEIDKDRTCSIEIYTSKMWFLSTYVSLNYSRHL